MVMMVIGNLKKILTQKLWVVKKYTWRLIHLNQAKKIKKKKRTSLSYHTKILNMTTVIFQISGEMMNSGNGAGTTR